MENEGRTAPPPPAPASARSGAAGAHGAGQAHIFWQNPAGSVSIGGARRLGWQRLLPPARPTAGGQSLNPSHCVRGNPIGRRRGGVQPELSHRNPPGIPQTRAANPGRSPERVNSLLKSKSPAEQLNLLRDLGTTVGSLASLAGITGFSRISHLAGAMDALIKDLQKKPAQLTTSVLRTTAHASDCLNVLFRDLTILPQDIPQSMLILSVDDEPISRRTLSVALGKANLRCIGMEDSRMALTILKENPFDLIFPRRRNAGVERLRTLRPVAQNADQQEHPGHLRHQPDQI